MAKVDLKINMRNTRYWRRSMYSILSLTCFEKVAYIFHAWLCTWNFYYEEVCETSLFNLSIGLHFMQFQNKIGFLIVWVLHISIQCYTLGDNNIASRLITMPTCILCHRACMWPLLHVLHKISWTSFFIWYMVPRIEELLENGNY